jgi:hypothetical protein
VSRKLIFFLPRILSLLFVGFISLFALDVFGVYHGFELIIALFMHLLLPLGLLVFVILAWRYGLVGTIAFVGFAVFYAWQAREHPSWILLLSGPSLIVGLLYFLDRYLKRKIRKNHN